MPAPLHPVATLSALPLVRKDRRPGQGADETNVSRALGLKRLGASYFVVRPGESAFPYHVHYGEDELIYVIEGEGTYRFGDQSYAVSAGDMLSAPAGGLENAHQLTNTGNGPLRYFCVSDLPPVNVGDLPEVGELVINVRAPDGTQSVPTIRIPRPEPAK
ncbi:MAG TPA: cupin domain-containing protein [Devosia sp.]|nr:cupin domain-containing protein [Devosia sp.]